MFIVPLHAEGVTVNPIRLGRARSDFCEEFFDDVKIPAGNLVGAFNDGWSVASRLLFHERSMVGDSGMNDTRFTIPPGEEGADPLVALVRQLGVGSDPLVRQLLGEALTLAHLKGVPPSSTSAKGSAPAGSRVRARACSSCSARTSDTAGWRSGWRLPATTESSGMV